MASDTLVLDVSYMPVDYVPWQTSVVWWLVDKSVEIVDEHPDRYIRTVNWTVKMPSVVRFLKPVKRKKVVKFSRHNVFARDKGNCQYCGRKVPRAEFTYDHVVPRTLGGKTSWENVVVSCVTCNQSKAGRTPEQARMKLLSVPKRPKSLPDHGPGTKLIQWEPSMPTSWRQWLRDAVYWDGSLEEE